MSFGRGRKLPDLERKIRLVDMVAYAGATWDWHRLHYDRQYVAEQGLQAPVIDGQMFGALLAEHVVSAAGPATRVVAMRFRFASMAFAEEVVIVHGVVTAADDVEGHRRVTVEQRLLTSTGRVIIDSAETQVELTS